MSEWTIVGSVAVAAITVCGTWLATKVQHKGKPENALIDQLQEEMGAMRQDITDLKTEQQKSKRRERIRDDYINKLRRHIEDGNPPPAPDWPEGLYD
jgi:outer membrane murein-binding lipoprotein Lpp